MQRNLVGFFPFNITAKAGYSLLEVVIALVILSTTLLLSTRLGLQQIQQNRQTLLLNQLHMQVDVLALLIKQNPDMQTSILSEWQRQLQHCFSNVKINTLSLDSQIRLEIMLFPYDLRVVIVSHADIYQKILTRHDAG